MNDVALLAPLAVDVPDLREPAPLTGRQREVATFIASHIRRRGYPPTLREIADAIGAASNHSAWLHLKALARKGVLTWERGSGRNRTIRLVTGDPVAMTKCPRHSGCFYATVCPFCERGIA